MEKFNPADFEQNWQKLWEKEGVYQPDLKNAKKPYYNLMMFPYPSAEGLHVGNVYAFTGVDIHGRFMRMRGYDVFEPIGLDGFGIHSENYALKIGKHPKEQAKISQENFYRQLRSIGNGFAWKNRLETYDPEYYKWTQWIFVQMFKHGLAYRKKSSVNFCPSCKTVLSDEQVIKKLKSQISNLKSDQLDELGQSVCERCGTQVAKKEMEQWFFRITDYAERLLQNTFRKDFNWTEKVKIGQRNWIGKKEGINITYPVVDEKGTPLIFNVGDARQVNNKSKTKIPIMKTDLMEKTIVNPLTGYYGEEKQNLREPVASEEFGIEALTNTAGQDPQNKITITCFTTRPDTNFGATFIVIGPEHSFVEFLLDPSNKSNLSNLTNQKIKAYVKKAKSTSEQERIAAGRKKTGVLTGYYCINQLTNYKMPVYISDFVLGHVGTGAVVGVPGHDLRDFEFAGEFKIPILRVVVGKDGDTSEITRPEQVQEEEGTMVNSGFLNGKDIKSAISLMMDHLEKKGWGKKVTTYKLRDWCISRQRYWGAPIPMIYCSSCAKSGKDTSGVARRDSPDGGGKKDDYMVGWFPVPDDQLPVLLPDLKDWKPEGTGKGPLAKLPDFVKVKCPKCGADAERETDVCDTFLDSSWYFLRYPSIGIQTRFVQGDKPGLENLPWNREITRRWLPVHSYIGGAEHTVLHLLYSRFVWMVLRDFGYLDFSGGARPGSAWDEPYKRFYAHGLIIAEGAKMSKSRGNVIIPDEYIRKYGADTLRAYLMFLGPFDQGGDFRDTGIAGMHRFLGRVWRLVIDFLSSNKSNKSNLSNSDFVRIMHKTIKKVTEDLENLRYNTAIAHIMEFVNYLTESLKDTSDGVRMHSSEVEEAVKVLLLLLAPFAPHMTEELWSRFISHKLVQSVQLDQYRSIHLHPWPSYDPKYLIESEITIVVQINGKTRDVIKVAISHLMEETVTKLAQKSEKVAKHLAGQKIRKTIFVPGKLINFVI